MGPLRILQLYPKGDFFTGAAIQLFDLACGLRRRGHHVVLATRPSDIWTAKSNAAGIPHYAVPMAGEFHFPSVPALVRLIRQHAIQVVHAHKGKARTLAMIAGFFAPIPVLILNRGVSDPISRLGRFGYTTRRVTAIIAVCQSIKRRLVAAGVPAGKIEVIYSGTDTDRFHPGVDGSAVRRELGLGPDDFLATQIGVRMRKGNEDVLLAMARVAREAPQAHLLLIGSRQPGVLHEAARRLGFGSKCRVLGYREDIPEILAASNLCVDASWAGLGLTGAIRESLAVETPVVATDVEGNPELVTDGETGLLVAPREPEALATAILRVIRDPARASEMARAGRKRVEAMCSLRVKIARTEEFYARLLTARAPARPAQGRRRMGRS